MKQPAKFVQGDIELTNSHKIAKNPLIFTFSIFVTIPLKNAQSFNFSAAHSVQKYRLKNLILESYKFTIARCNQSLTILQPMVYDQHHLSR